MIKDLWRASDESYTNMNHLQTNHKGYTEEHWPEIAIVWTGQSEFSCTKTTKGHFSSIQATEFDGFWEQKYNVIIEGTHTYFQECISKVAIFFTLDLLMPLFCSDLQLMTSWLTLRKSFKVSWNFNFFWHIFLGNKIIFLENQSLCIKVYQDYFPHLTTKLQIIAM